MPVIDERISAEIDALAAEINRLHSEAVKASEREARETGVSKKAMQWIGELHHMLRWADRFPPKGEPISINVPKFLRAFRRGPKGAPALAQWISNGLVLVSRRSEELSGVPGLTPEFLEEGERIKVALSNVRRGRGRGSDAYRAALKERDDLVQLLMDRVSRVRTAARFVFRNHPAIRRAAMSDFERKRRNRNRKKQGE